MEGPAEAPVSKCRRFWKVLISAIHKAEALGPPLLGRWLGAERGERLHRQAVTGAAERPVQTRHRLPPGDFSANRYCPLQAGAPE